MGNKTTDWMCFHSRFIKIWRMERLGVVCIQRVAVVESERLPSFLVFGKVPAGGELRLESLWGHKRWRGKRGLPTWSQRWKWEPETGRRKDSPQLSGANHWQCWGLIFWPRGSEVSCCHSHLIALVRKKVKKPIYSSNFYFIKSFTEFKIIILFKQLVPPV